MNQTYLDTARQMIQVAPLVFADNVFVLKGDTAINLFLRDMPRLSVDLDLVFVDHRLGRDEALAKINDAIRSAVYRLKKREFLLSLARSEPNWELLRIEHLEHLPGVRWKLENLGRLAKANAKKFKEQAQELERLLGKF